MFWSLNCTHLTSLNLAENSPFSVKNKKIKPTESCLTEFLGQWGVNRCDDVLNSMWQKCLCLLMRWQLLVMQTVLAKSSLPSTYALGLTSNQLESCNVSFKMTFISIDNYMRSICIENPSTHYIKVNENLHQWKLGTCKLPSQKKKTTQQVLMRIVSSTSGK